MDTRLKTAIDVSGLKQVWIAKKIGIDPTVLNKYISGEREAPKDVIVKIAKILKVPQWNLL